MIRIVGVVVMLRETSLERLWFLKSSGSVYLSTDHLNESGVLINNVTVNYSKYAPSYTYTKTGDDEADYYLQATKKPIFPIMALHHVC